MHKCIAWGLVVVVITVAGCASPETRVARGDDLYLQGRYDRALDEYQKARRKDPTFFEIDEKIHRTQVRIYLDRGDRAVDACEWTKAERAYQEVRRLDPDHPDIAARFDRLSSARADHHFALGHRLLAQGNPFDAITELELALAVQPDHPRAQQALERAWTEKRDREARAVTAFEAGSRARSAGELEEAMRHFSEALELDPFHPRAELERRTTQASWIDALVVEGDRAMREQRWGDALECYRDAFQRAPHHPTLASRIRHAERENLALDWANKGDRALASREFRRAYESFEQARCLTSDPEWIYDRWELARNGLAAHLFRQAEVAERDGRYEEALEFFLRVSEVYPGFREVESCYADLARRVDEAHSTYEAGSIAVGDGDLFSARGHFLACRESIPNYLDVSSRLETVQQDLTLAESLYERAERAEAAGRDERARILFEECLAITRPFRNAAERIARLHTRRSGDRITIYDDACDAHTHRNHERALELLLECESAHPGHQDVPSRLDTVRSELERAGEIYDRGVGAERRGEVREARKLFRECLAISRPYRDAEKRLAKLDKALQHLRTAQRLDRERRLTEARRHYRSFLDSHPGHAFAAQRLAAIDHVVRDLGQQHRKLVEAERVKDFRTALTLAVGIQRRCVGYEGVDERIPEFEAAAHYADGCAFENEGRYDLAVRAFERCAERKPGHRDVQSRLEKCRRQRRN